MALNGMKFSEKQKFDKLNETVELVSLRQKYASKWVFYGRYMALNGGENFVTALIRQVQQVCMRSAPIRALQGSVRLGQSLRSFPWLTPPTFLQPWSLLRKALIRAAKTSHTAGTLCAIFL
jgi:hypothetical protein